MAFIDYSKLLHVLFSFYLNVYKALGWIYAYRQVSLSTNAVVLLNIAAAAVSLVSVSLAVRGIVSVSVSVADVVVIIVALVAVVVAAAERLALARAVAKAAVIGAVFGMCLSEKRLCL